MLTLWGQKRETYFRMADLCRHKAAEVKNWPKLWSMAITSFFFNNCAGSNSLVLIVSALFYH